MTPAELITHLECRNITLSLRDGRLFADPVGQLLPDELAWIKANRDWLIEHLANEGRSVALTAFDADHPTRFDGSDLQRVLLRWPDQPGWLVLPQPVLDFVLTWNAAARQRASKLSGATRKPTRKSTQKALYAPIEEPS